MAKAIDFIFGAYNIDTSDWSMDFGTGAKFAFRSRVGTPCNFFASFRQELQENMSREDLKLSCAEIKTRALEKTKSYYHQNIPASFILDVETTDLRQRCMGCHSTFDRGFAPTIPFDKPELLKEKLLQGVYPRGRLIDEIFYRIGPHADFSERMPADGYIPKKQEVENFKSYLKGLISES